ncbi:MAG: transcription antitermination factor NusB [Alphaproteobacteria bacterium]|nr:transcription antitermination factor NusB [Alphaproteobacteria bacterium]
MDNKKINLSGSNAAKRLARLAAVQVLYQVSFGEEKLDDILGRNLEEFVTVLNGDEGDEGEGPMLLGAPDSEMVADIARGTMAHKETLEEMVGGSLGPNRSLARMERLLQVLLCAGAYELYHHGEIDAPIIISDYVDVTCAFFNDKEPALVNAILDSIGKKVRS